MKIIKNIYLLGFFLALIGFSACSENPIDYIPAEIDGKAHVYFPKTNGSIINVAKADASVDIPISRVGTEDALTVSLIVTGGDGSYNIPTTVTFAQGQLKSSVKVTFDSEEIEFDDYKDVKIAISEDYTSPYGKSEYSFKIGIPSPWTSLGKATFVEDFVTTFYGVDNIPYEVEIQENDLIPGLYRLVNPFGKDYPYNEPGDWDNSKNWYLEINASDPEGVYIDLQEVGMDWGNGMFSMGSIAWLRMSQGKTLEEVKADGLTGTLNEGIITFPVNQLLISMANYNNGGRYGANNNGAFMVIMPGVELTDYTIDLVYGGKYYDAKDKIEGVVAIINEIGEDVDKVKLAIVKEGDAENAVEGITDGEIESVEIKSQTGKVLVPFAEVPEDGRYAIVAVTFDSEGNARGSTSSIFKYVNTSETWTKIETGDYTYTLFFGEIDNPAIDKGLILYQSDKDPTRFKIEDWGTGVDFVFTHNIETGKIIVEDQETGFVHSSLGVVFVGDLTNHSETNTKPSFFKDGVFNFGVVYFVDAGYLKDTSGYETFEITAEEVEIPGTRSSSVGRGLEINENFPFVVKANKKVFKSNMLKKPIF